MNAFFTYYSNNSNPWSSYVLCCYFDTFLNKNKIEKKEYRVSLFNTNEMMTNGDDNRIGRARGDTQSTKTQHASLPQHHLRLLKVRLMKVVFQVHSRTSATVLVQQSHFNTIICMRLINKRNKKNESNWSGWNWVDWISSPIPLRSCSVSFFTVVLL